MSTPSASAAGAAALRDFLEAAATRGSTATPSKVTEDSFSPGTKPRNVKATSICRRLAISVDEDVTTSVPVLWEVPVMMWKYPSRVTSNTRVTAEVQVVSNSVQRSTAGVRVTAAGMGSKL